MPKISNSRSKAKPSRKPLKEISNGIGRNISKQSKINTDKEKQISPVEKEEEEEDNNLDQLLLVHSDLSNLIQQIDELVVEAVKVEGTSKEGRKEIDLFTNVLSDMHSTLKSWIPRFRNLLTSPTVESGHQLEQSSPRKTFPDTNEEAKSVDDSPVQSDLDSFISPSPLVSWCTERTVESGRQLFLLTPLPRSTQLSSKLRGSSRSIFARKMDEPLNTNLGGSSLLTICQNTDNNMLEGKDMRATPVKCGKSSFTEMKTSLDHDFVSPPKFVNRNRSMFLMTPRPKMSPPKSCVLLEPIIEPCRQNNSYIPKATPFHAGTQTHAAATPYSIRFSESLASKYPELFGTHQTYKSGMGGKEVDAPVASLISPLKSCVLMEPTDKKLSMNLATNGNLFSHGCIFDEQAKSLAAAPNKVQGENQSIKETFNQELGSASMTHPECTPMCKEPESRINTGKQPGENTLKRELWTRFDAASSTSNVLRLNVSVFGDTSRKGFLDRLEEEFGD